MTVRILTILLLSILSAGCFDDAVLNDVIANLVERPPVSIAAWNIRIFSDNSRDDQELMMIADILVNYDFIAIVEVRDERVLMRTESLLQGMGRDYDYLNQPPSGCNGKGTLRVSV